MVVKNVHLGQFFWSRNTGDKFNCPSPPLENEIRGAYQKSTFGTYNEVSLLESHAGVTFMGGVPLAFMKYLLMPAMRRLAHG